MRGIVIALSIGIVACLSASVWIGRGIYDSPGPLNQAADIVIPKGSALNTLGVLQSKSVVGMSLPETIIFRVSAYLTRHDGALHSAELHFPAHSSIKEALAVLRHEAPVEHKLTIPEGLTAYQIRELIEQAPSMVGAVPAVHEGAILPETYDYQWGTSRAVFVDRLIRQSDLVTKKVWANRDPDSSLVDSKQMIILASMVERETGLPGERARVAGVFFNRLQRKMRLQSDPTVIYDLSDGRGHIERALSHADLFEPGPYNTYVIEGLPPGPICSPGRAALEAVTHPAHETALYFVSDGRGGASAFSETLTQHNQHVTDFRIASKMPSKR